jgi:CheY-like chemotaxis protein
MQLHYNILWIDNDLQEYIDRGALVRLSQFLIDLGFKPYIVPLFDESELDTHLNQTKFDLIISDYQLDNTTGDKIVEHIRDKKVLTEILFYSAKLNFKDEIGEKLKFVDRISFQLGRDTLLERIEGLLKLTLDKLLELNATRGLITSETSQLDVQIEELVIELAINRLKITPDELNKIINHYATDFLATREASFNKRFEEIGFENIFPSIEATRKWNIFRDLLKTFNKVDESEVITSFLKKNSTYFNQVIDIRNKFAHSKAMEKNGKTVLKGQYGKEDFEFDDDACVAIRKQIIAHSENFNELLAHLGIEV